MDLVKHTCKSEYVQKLAILLMIRDTAYQIQQKIWYDVSKDQWKETTSISANGDNRSKTYQNISISAYQKVWNVTVFVIAYHRKETTTLIFDMRKSNFHVTYNIRISRSLCSAGSFKLLKNYKAVLKLWTHAVWRICCWVDHSRDRNITFPQH